MFSYAPVDCKSISSYEATNGVYHGQFLRRPGCRYVVPRCRGGIGVTTGVCVYVCVCVCVCVCVAGVLLFGGGGGGGNACVSRDAFELQ